MPKLGDLTGTPWHVEKFTRAEGDERRHRSRCIYYKKADSYCSIEMGHCMGAAHCDYYKEKPKAIPARETKLAPKSVSKDKESAFVKNNFPVGAKVRHTKYGLGKVIAFEGGIVKVKFEEGQENPIRFDAALCFRNKILVRVFYD